MELLLIFHHLRVLSQRGGLRSWQIGYQFAKSGNIVNAIVPGIDPLTELRHPLLKWWKLSIIEFIDGIKVVRVNSLPNIRKYRLSRAFYFLSFSFLQLVYSLLLGKPDVIICSSMPSTQLMISWIISRIRKIPYVVDVRDLSLDYAAGAGYIKKSLWWKMLIGVENYMLRNADIVITISEGIKLMVIGKGVVPEKVHNLPIGFDKETYERSIDWSINIRKKYCVREGFIVLYTGSMGHMVDVLTLLKAAKLLRNRMDIHWIFAGGGQMANKYKAFIQENKLNATMLGEIPKSDVILFCKEANVCLYALEDKEIFSTFLGNKVFDYLGSGAPLFYCGPEGDISNLIKETKGGIRLESGDYYGLAKEIEKLAGGNEQDFCTEYARNYIERYYLSSISMAKFEKLVKSVSHYE